MRVDETGVALGRERGMRFKETLEVRVAENMGLLDLHALNVVDRRVDGTELRVIAIRRVTAVPS